MQPLFAGLPPALRGLCMKSEEPALASPKSKGRKSKAPAQEEAEEDQINATAPEQQLQDAPADMHDLPMGALPFKLDVMKPKQHSNPIC